ncbi:SPOSA6832_02049, partial [Sporobolomyces salmonicolor]
LARLLSLQARPDRGRRPRQSLRRRAPKTHRRLCWTGSSEARRRSRVDYKRRSCGIPSLPPCWRRDLDFERRESSLGKVHCSAPRDYPGETLTSSFRRCSSMEIGVRVMKESNTDPLNAETYCCHGTILTSVDYLSETAFTSQIAPAAYLTFVAKPTPPPAPNVLLAISDYLGLTKPPPPRRAQLPEIKPASLLEQKRYLLAGRRRAHRIQNAKTNDSLLASFREFLDSLEQRRRRELAEAAPDQDDLILKLQEEILVEAYMRNDPDVRIDGDEVVGSIEGYVDPVRIKKSVIEKAALKRGRGGWIKIPLPTDEVVDQATSHRIPSSFDVVEKRRLELASTVDFADTLCMCLWIVRPQHCNSKSILFGGTLMRWVEEVSSIAARRIFPQAAWSSATIDSLTFKSAVQPGEVVYARAAVVRVWDSSIEVACTVAIDPESGHPLKGTLRQVRLPEGPAQELAAGADKRRDDRLQDKRILQRCVRFPPPLF